MKLATKLIVIIIGMIELFKKKYQELKNIYYKERILKNSRRCGPNLFIGGKSHINRNTYLGRNVSFNGMAINGGGKVVIGNYFHSGTNCQMIVQNHNYDFGEKIPYDSTFIFKDIIIEDNVWIGNNVILLGGITIGEGSIIQAGSVVVRSVDKYSIVGGSPAKKFLERNIEHYIRLKEKKLFH